MCNAKNTPAPSKTIKLPTGENIVGFVISDLKGNTYKITRQLGDKVYARKLNIFERIVVRFVVAIHSLSGDESHKS